MQLIIKNLSKTYPNGTKALDGVNLTIDKGMFGLLGPNGAGKSTLMRTISTLQEPDTGSAQIGDINILESPMELRKILGYLPQSFGVYPKMTANKLLHYFAALKGIASKKDRETMVDYVLDITNLTKVKNREVARYSGGMRQRFGIAQLLLNKPKLIIVDEPTAGLDPAERHRFLNVLRALGKDHIVLFSTHIVDDVKDLCTDMAIMNNGRILLNESPQEAVGKLEGKIWEKTINPEELESHEGAHQVISSNFKQNNQLGIRVLSATQPNEAFQQTEVELEDVYFSLLNKLTV
ncbi:MAG: ABC transporter ATP-binding protein [Saprospiraceae bacterium]